MVNEALLSLLVCPLGKAPLRREGDDLICTRCGPRFSHQGRHPQHADRGGRTACWLWFHGQPRLRSIR